MVLAPEVEVLIPTLAVLPMAVMTTDRNGVVCWANTCLSALTGYGVDEIAGQDAGMLFSGDAAHSHREVLCRVVSTGEPWRGESAGRRKNGDLYHIDQTITPIRDATGKTTHLLWIQLEARDGGIADELRRCKEELDILNHNSPIPYQSLDAEGRLIAVNEAWLQALGYLREEVIGRWFGEFLAPDQVDLFREQFAKTKERGWMWDVEVTVAKKDGNHIHASFDGNIGRDRNGQFRQTHCVWRDITERKLAAEKLEQLQKIVGAAQLAAHFGVFQWNVKTGKNQWSPETFYLYGLDPATTDPSFDVWLQTIHPDDRDRISGELRRTLASPEGRLNIEYRLADGLTWIAGSGQLYRDSEGNPDHIVGINIDITERKRMVAALRTSKEQFAKAFLSSPAVTTVSDLDDGDRLLDVNEAFEKVSGYRREEAIGRTSKELGLWADPGEYDEATKQFRAAGGLRNFEYHFRRKNGYVGTGLISAELIELEGKRCAIAATIDITDRKLAEEEMRRKETENAALEEELRQAQKLESIGRLAGGVAHDFNNLLTVINGYSDLLIEEVKAPDPLRSYVEPIRKAGERAVSLTRQLLAFSRKQMIQPRVLDLNTTIRESAPMLQRLIGEDVALEIHLDGFLGRVKADPDQIHQVIMNLAVNARDAMPDGGKLRIETRNVELDGKGGTAIHPDIIPGSYILMTVTDTGHGMDAATRRHIFEPFFTTKETGKGTGLGLSTVYGIVRQSGGWIDVCSELGAGTAFKIYLPRIDEALVAEANAIDTPAAGGSETILVVEDQEAVRSFTKAALKQYGYRVIEAGDGEEAIAVTVRYSGEIHLLLTDVVLPGMNGKELSGRLRLLLPNLKVLFASGYTADVIADRGVIAPGIAFLHKPFSPDQLAAKVRDVLSSPSQPIM
jgi:PAS domain S-box-containing protein